MAGSPLIRECVSREQKGIPQAAFIQWSGVAAVAQKEYPMVDEQGNKIDSKAEDTSLPTSVILGHELIHAYNIMNGTNWPYVGKLNPYIGGIDLTGKKEAYYYEVSKGIYEPKNPNEYLAMGPQFPVFRMVDGKPISEPDFHEKMKEKYPDGYEITEADLLMEAGKSMARTSYASI